MSSCFCEELTMRNERLACLNGLDQILDQCVDSLPQELCGRQIKSLEENHSFYHFENFACESPEEGQDMEPNSLWI